MVMTSAWRTERARLAALRRHHPDDPTVGTEALRRLRTIRGDEDIRALVTGEPAIHLSDRVRWARILLGGER